MAIFNSYVKLPEGKWCIEIPLFVTLFVGVQLVQPPFWWWISQATVFMMLYDAYSKGLRVPRNGPFAPLFHPNLGRKKPVDSSEMFFPNA